MAVQPRLRTVWRQSVERLTPLDRLAHALTAPIYTSLFDDGVAKATACSGRGRGKIGAEVLIETSEQMTRRIETEFSIWGGIIESANITEKQGN